MHASFLKSTTEIYFGLSLCINGRKSKEFIVSGFDFGMKREGLIGFYIFENGKSQVQYIVTIPIVHTGKDKCPPGIQIISYFHDSLRKKGKAAQHQDRKYQKRFKRRKNGIHIYLLVII
jgi:hypothetical protein